jgi:hypothetical protein
MPDELDLELRRLTTALVADAPPLPPFPVRAPLWATVTTTRARRRPRLVLAATALVLVIALVAVLAVVLFDDTSRQSRIRPGGSPPGLDGEWRELPTTVDGASLKTTYPFAIDGDTLLTIDTSSGGDGVTGEIYEFGDNTVRAIAPSGMEWRSNAAVVWTGTEVIVAAGSNGPGITHVAAAYDPATDFWRALPDPPSPVFGPAVWAGHEMVAWQSGLAFDPATYRWRQIAGQPLTPRRNEAVVATPYGVFVWGGCDPLGPNGGQCDDFEFTGDELVGGAMYDPAADVWTMLPSSPLTGGDYVHGVWTGSEVVVLVDDPPTTEGVFAAAYNPKTEQWRTLPNPPRVGEKYAVSVWTGHYVLTHSPRGGAVTAFDPRTNKWFTLPAGPDRDRQSAVWVHGELVITGGYPTATPWAFRP